MLAHAALLAAVSVSPIRAPRMWTPVGQPMYIDVLQNTPGGSLAVMSHDGELLSDPIDAASMGNIDLLATLPVIAAIDHAVYVQLVGADGRPIGSPLVVEPALSRRVPVTEVRTDEDRGSWTAIVGWMDEGAEDAEPTEGGRIDGAATPNAVPRDDVAVRNGFWIYGESDVLMETDHGDLMIDLREDAAPNTARNFKTLATRHFYDNTIAHRIIPNGRHGRPFVVQGGDPTGTGSGGPGWWLPIEPSTLGHAFGVISMARADDPDSAGSQWFIALDRLECARLDGLYCAFGEVVSGGATIESMALTPLADSDYFSSRPVTPPRVIRARTLAAPPRVPGFGRPDSRVKPPTTPPWTP